MSIMNHDVRFDLCAWSLMGRILFEITDTNANFLSFIQQHDHHHHHDHSHDHSIESVMQTLSQQLRGTKINPLNKPRHR
jgi:hypothetical protein